MMRSAICVGAIAVLSMCATMASLAQPRYPRVVAKFPGASLKWVHIADPEFQKKGINLEHYTVSVLEDDKDTVDVLLMSLDASTDPRVMGSSGTYPGFTVEISKANDKIVRSYYIR